MTKLTVSVYKGKAQYKISIPIEIIRIKGWDEDTEICFIPFLEAPNVKLSEETPIILKKIEKKL